jgi:hypothetical protein
MLRVSSTPDNDRMPRDYRTMNHRGTAYSDTTGPVHSGSTDGGVCFRSSQATTPPSNNREMIACFIGYFSWGFETLAFQAAPRRTLSRALP